MPTWLPTAIIAALCIASAAVWCACWRRVRTANADSSAPPGAASVPVAGERSAASATRPPPVVPPGAIIFAGLWMLYHLVGDLTAILEGAAVPAFDPERTMKAMQQSCWLLGAGAGVTWMLLTRGEHAQFQAFGVEPRGLAAQVRAGVSTVTAAWLPVFAVLWATSPLRTAERQHSVFQLLGLRPSLEMYAWAVLAAVIVAPLFEELLFRVIVQTWFERQIGRAAIPVVAVLFAAVHGFPDSLAIVPLALVLGDAYQRRRSYAEIVTAHALFNATMLALAAVQPHS